MHQTEGQNYNGSDPDIAGRAFKDETAGTPGSTMIAEWANAVQQELKNAIEAAGLTIASTGAADRTAGWAQLAQAITTKWQKKNVASVGSAGVAITFSNLLPNTTYRYTLNTEAVVASTLPIMHIKNNTTLLQAVLPKGTNDASGPYQSSTQTMSLTGVFTTGAGAQAVTLEGISGFSGGILFNSTDLILEELLLHSPTTDW